MEPRTPFATSLAPSLCYTGEKKEVIGHMEAKNLYGTEAAKPSAGLLPSLFPEFYEGREGRSAVILGEALTFAVSLLLSRTHLAFGMYPFAFALLAARRRRLVPAALGAAVGALSLGAVGGVFLLAYVALLGLRVLLSLPVPKRVLFPVTEQLFGERTGLSVMAAALVGTGLAAYELLAFGVTTYALFFASAAILSPPLLTLLFSAVYEARLGASDVLGGLSEIESGEKQRTPLVELSALSLLVSLVYALRPISLFGLSFATLSSVGITLFAARRLGAPRAGVAGLLLGLVGPVAYAPAYALLGVVTGLLFPYGASVALLAGSLAAIGFSSYIEGLSGFLAFAPECAVTILVAFPLLGRLPSAVDPAEAELSRRRRREAVKEVAARPVAESNRLHRLGTAFSALSSMFYRLSDESRRPAAAEYFVECEKVCARHCATCSNRVRCWEQGERVAERSVYALANTLRTTGKISSSELPPELRSGCPRIEQILEEIREECASLGLRRYKGDRNEFLSHDYAMLAKVLSDTAARDGEEASEDVAAAERLLAALGDAGRGLTVSVFGARAKRVAVGSERGADVERVLPLLPSAAEEVLGCAVTPPIIESKDGVTVASVRAKRRYKATTASAAVPSTSHEPSGDRLRFFETEEGIFYAILSDGMGSGEAASRTAAVSVEFLEAMLSSGCSRKTALRMLNNLVRTREDECSATVDLLALDLVYGNATFLKSGAAPSYIKRGAEIFRVRSRTMPIGLFKTPDAERIHVETKVGDVLVLLSDGIVPENEDPAWLIALLAEEKADDLGALAERIVAEAVSREGRDDITVGLVAVG